MNIDEDEERITDQIICTAAHLIRQYYVTYIYKTPCMTSSQTGHAWLMEMLRGHGHRCYNMFRMDINVFIKLSTELRSNYGLKDSRRMTVDEMLAMFLFTLGHGASNRLVSERFQHSGETVSRYFNMVLDCICTMSVNNLKPEDPEFKSTPKEILKDNRFMPHFKVIMFFLLINFMINFFFLSSFTYFIDFSGLYWCYRWCPCFCYHIS